LKDIFILGGPNGAGKTTAARVLLPSKLRANTYINADEIARGIAPLNPDSAALTAGRVMLKRIEELIAAGTSFAFETTCAGRSYVPLLENCKRDGWKVSLTYLWVPSPEYSLARVERRVS
jgi:predicted ABC-type ATPase